MKLEEGMQACPRCNPAEAERLKKQKAKKRWISIGIVSGSLLVMIPLVVLLFLKVGGLFPTEDGYAEETAPPAAEEEQVEPEGQQEGNDPVYTAGEEKGWEDYEQDYQDVLERYRTAFQEEWTMEQYMDAQISYLYSYIDVANIGYTFMDVDADGSEELLVGEKDSDGIIYDMYTLRRETPELILSSAERSRYYLAEDGAIVCEGSNSALQTIYEFYDYLDGTLIWQETVSYDAYRDEENPWFYADSTAEDEKPISEEQAREIIDSHPYIDLEYTSFAETEPSNEEDTGETAGELTEADLNVIKEELMVPVDLQVETVQSEPYYWDSGEIWLVNVEFYYNGNMVAGATVDAETLEAVRNIFVYSLPEETEGISVEGTWRTEGYDEMTNWASSYQIVFREDGTVECTGWRNRDCGYYERKDASTVTAVYTEN